VALISLAGIGTAQAAAKTAMDEGGAFCFRFAYPGPGATKSVLSLDVDPADHPTKQRLWWVSGVEKATNPDVRVDNYVNSLAGSATLAKPNNGVAGPKVLHLALTGTSYGSDYDPAVTGIWQLAYTLQLDPKTLKGKIIALSTFTAVAADGTAGEPVTYAVNSAVRPMSCSKI